VIPRYQKIILWLLLIGSVFMAAYLIRMRARAQYRMAAIPDEAPMPAPVETPPVLATLVMANDADGSLATSQMKLALPAEATTRARALLNDLFAEYAQHGSQHPLPDLPAVSDVFLLPVPTSNSNRQAEHSQGTQLAVVNLHGEFADHHPSGIEVETLTLLSMLGTLHANMPQITQVQFLVDGQQKQTLAGHADLTRTYLAGGDAPQPAEIGAPPTANAGPAPPDHSGPQP